MKIRKLIAPVIITLLLVLYFAGFASAALLFDIPLWAKLIFSIIPLALAGVAVFVLIERIKEEKKGEKDDLSKY